MNKFWGSVLLVAPTAALAANLDVANQIRHEGLYQSEVMQTLEHLTDKIGPRLTNSPQMREASRWTLQQLKDWGLKNGQLHAFEFGRGWSSEASSITLTARASSVYMACRSPGRLAPKAPSAAK